MIFRAYGRSDIGKVRKNNEDHQGMILPAEDEPRPALFVVADGVGGSRYGEVASEMAVEGLKKRFASQEERFAEYSLERDHELRDGLAQRISGMIAEVNSEIYTRGRKEAEYHGMSTTTVALVTVGHGAFLGHVGDSRAYLVRRGEIYRLTEDHTWATYMVKTRLIDPADLVDHPYSNVLSRSVGNQPHVEVDTTYVQVEPDDRFILCSDGLTKYLSGQDILEVSKNATAPDELAERLITAATSLGGEDNVTVLVVEAIGGVETMRSMALHKEIELLQRVFLFEQLTPQEIMRLMRITYKQHRQAGEVIIHEGSHGHELYIVAEGSVDVSLRKKHLATIEAGGHFGELALLDNEERAATVTARSDVTLLTIKQEDFHRIVQSDPQVATKLLWSFLKVVAGSVRSLSKEVVSFSALLGSDADATLIDFEPQRFD